MGYFQTVRLKCKLMGVRKIKINVGIKLEFKRPFLAFKILNDVP